MAKDILLIPTHTKWKEFKKKWGVPDGAVSGINVGKALDAFHSKEKAGTSRTTLQGNLAACQELEKVLSNFISKLDKKKIKEYEKFKKAFLDGYAGIVHAKAEDYKRYSADAETYGKEILALCNAATKLKKEGTTLKELQDFRSGPVRGALAVGTGTTGVDTSQIKPLLSTIDNTINSKLTAETPQNMIDTFVASVHAAIEKVHSLAGAQGIF